MSDLGSESCYESVNYREICDEGMSVYSVRSRIYYIG